MSLTSIFLTIASTFFTSAIFYTVGDLPDQFWLTMLVVAISCFGLGAVCMMFNYTYSFTDKE